MIYPAASPEVSFDFFDLSPRAQVALESFAAFVAAYFTDESKEPLNLSAGQRYACEVLQEGVFSGQFEGAGIEMARGHGKSLLMKASVIFAFIRSRYLRGQWGARYAVVLTSGQLYKQFSRDLAELVIGDGAPLVVDTDGRSLLHADFWVQAGDRYPERRRKDRQLWSVGERLIYVGGWDHPCRLSVRGMTAGRGDVRGLTQGVQRPDYLIIDDPMKEQEADNFEVTENVKSFVKKSFIPCGSPGKRVAYFGTPFNSRDLITEVCGNARTEPRRSDWPGLRTCALPAIHPKTGAALAPHFPVEKLEARRVEIGTRAFYQEYRLDPQGGGLKHFEASWIERNILAAPTRQMIQLRKGKRAMYLDPSLGRTKRSDYSAIVVVDSDPTTGVWWVRAASVERRRPTKIVSDALDLYREFRPDLWACEDEGFQELLLPAFRTEIASRNQVAPGTYPPEAIPRLQSSEGVPKVTRIKRLCPFVENGLLCFDQQGEHRELRRQLELWGGQDDETDDGPDSLEGAMRLGGAFQKSGLAAIQSRLAGLR